MVISSAPTPAPPVPAHRARVIPTEHLAQRARRPASGQCRPPVSIEDQVPHELVELVGLIPLVTAAVVVPLERTVLRTQRRT